MDGPWPTGPLEIPALKFNLIYYYYVHVFPSMYTYVYA